MTRLFLILTLFLGCADFSTAPPQKRNSADYHITRTNYGGDLEEWEDTEHHVRCYFWNGINDRPALSCVKDINSTCAGKTGE